MPMLYNNTNHYDNDNGNGGGNGIKKMIITILCNGNLFSYNTTMLYQYDNDDSDNTWK